MKSFPKFWNLLPETDKITYMSMKTQFTIASSQNQRNKRVSTFNEILQIIQRFCIKNDKNDWVRCFVCGVMWLPEGIAINNQQLRLLISKCKSSINGSLLRIGYTNSLGRTETAAAMVKAVPILKDNAAELRQWTVRSKSVKKPLLQVILSPEKIEIDKSQQFIDLPKYDEPEIDIALDTWSGLAPFIDFDFEVF
ncbi:hypothetical protein TRFO_16630 [Tritrichomonas foetus]|uniref:Initiator binding domain-containing protein n=1 Tax=Tritrichomonas foetus TaxID=1144522 RepID=A0A1J4KQB4_9EUKA|nr:hypothetical protein TRFO_16630 [Tritrichomonas foetus]|eukprot:OHT13298.1 hypothetical protein TRFO_16630 [Tritrichomonas foetus]